MLFLNIPKSKSAQLLKTSPTTFCPLVLRVSTLESDIVQFLTTKLLLPTIYQVLQVFLKPNTVQN